jgi:glutathione S-transferase
MICDSGVIIDYLEKTGGHRLDGRLTLAERAQSLAFRRLLEEHLYWAVVYARWADPDNAAHVNSYIAGATRLPPWLMPVVGRLIQRSVIKSLRGHGLGRHPPDTIWRLGMADVDALGHWLGGRPWAFGEAPTVLDAVMFAFIASIIRTPWEFPLKTHTLKHRNLVDHSQRMLALCFPEMARPSSP